MSLSAAGIDVTKQNGFIICVYDFEVFGGWVLLTRYQMWLQHLGMINMHLL